MDLPANINFDPNPDGWSIDQEADSIISVQLFAKPSRLIVELWGTTSVVTPSNKRYDELEFQQNSWIDMSDRSWTVKRIVYGVVDEGRGVDVGVNFERSGTAQEISAVRRF